MGWFDILKYNREHYVEASKKHNDPETIETHKKILELVEASPVKNKEMGRRIAQLKAMWRAGADEEEENEPE